DTVTDKAHCLNRGAAELWRHCDGRRSIDDLARHLYGDLPAERGEQVVRLGLERLRRRGLVEGIGKQAVVDRERRELIGRLAMAAAAGLAIPLVSSAMAPKPGYAVSCGLTGSPCNNGLECCSGVCLGGNVCL